MQHLTHSQLQHINFSTRRSKEKAIQFFGENAVPLHCGKGNSDKLNKVLNSKNSSVKKIYSDIIFRIESDRSSIGSNSSMESLENHLGSTSISASKHNKFSPYSQSYYLRSTPLYNKSTKKIENLMGFQCPVDISSQEIVCSGLSSLLQSRIPLCYFLAFLLSQRTSENLVL
ncbi:hypothetical protein HDU92_003820 [Lobulomyces angularis]|nr:hypothetical protein HDU92_003820 [Lobulomyces angularis]